MDFVESTKEYLGWCPNTPALHTVPSVLIDPAQSMNTGQPDGSGPADRSGRVRQGVSIAAGSLKAMAHDRQLLVFSFISGLVMFFLIYAEAWNDGKHYHILPFLITLSIGNSAIVFDPWIFLVEMICLFYFTLVLADLVLHRNCEGVYTPITIRERFTKVFIHAGPLSVLSIVLAFLTNMVFAIIYQSQFLTEILSAIFIIFFWPPFSYVLWDAINKLWLAFLILFINFIPFLVALCLVPAIVREEKGLVPALMGLITTVQMTWRELLGCGLVYGTIVILVAAIAFVIGQGPNMLIDNGYHLSMYLGHILMTGVYYGFIFVCLILMVAVYSAAGIAIADLHQIEERYEISGISECNLEKSESAS